MDSAPMEYLIRLAQMHETFRRPELEALAVLHNVDLEILEYSDQVRKKMTNTFHFLFADISHKGQNFAIIDVRRDDDLLLTLMDMLFWSNLIDIGTKG